MTKKKKIIVYVICAAALTFLLLPLMGFVFYRDWGFIDENTASRKGYRQYWMGLKTGHWYQKSPVEAFIAEKNPSELKQRWTSYAGTGKNIFGMEILYGHGKPGPIYQVQEKHLNEWFSELSDSEKKTFYDLLVTGDKDAIQKQIDSLMDALLEKYSK